MKRLLTALVIFVTTLHFTPPVNAAPKTGEGTSLHEGTLQSVGNARIRTTSEGFFLERIQPSVPIELFFMNSEGIGIQREQNQWLVLPTKLAPGPIQANTNLWVLPTDALSKEHAWRIALHNGVATASKRGDGLAVLLNTASANLSRAEARPHSDPFGNRFSLQMEGGAELENALAAFYWGTMLPSVVENTFAAHFPYSSGYVLSTLDTKAYAGSYPAVDHEFQIKGRLGMGTDVDLDVARRMIELQFKLMNDDPQHLFRSPTSVQPDGMREYHVRRDSKDARENAAMFPLTANIEVIEESWLYYQASKNKQWLREHLSSLENAAGWTLQSIDPYGRVWGDVYYEDQVIKDGRETEVQAFAARSFHLLAEIEALLLRHDKATYYRGMEHKIAGQLAAPLPQGYWDDTHRRFVDWVDRNSVPHDHVALLANTLPVTFGYASAEQADAVSILVKANAAEFERFPAFVAADIAAYSPSEMGTAGPYDLSAAGRYWFWDAAYRVSQRQNDILLGQLRAVAAEGKSSGYFMGERYDMDHVYYVDGKNAHGAAQYYEYPNVFASVLINDYLGLGASPTADVRVAPHLQGYGTVELHMPAYALRYTCTERSFTLVNLADKTRSFDVDLRSTALNAVHYTLKGDLGSKVTGPRSTLTLGSHQQAQWTPLP